MIRFELPLRRRLSAALFLVGLLSSAGVLADAGSSGAKTRSDTTGLASKTPAQIVSAAQEALRSARGYVMAGHLTQGKQKVGLQLTYSGAGRLEMKISQEAGTAAIIVLPGGAYIKANRVYWNSHGGRAVARYANRWIELPARDGTTFTRQLGQFDPDTLARCLDEDHGPLSLAGTTTVDGTRAVVIRDAGGVPGSDPGTLDIAASGPSYPLRATMTGPTLKGGKVDVCNDGKGSNAEGSLNLSRFNDPPRVTAPPNALKLTTA